MLKRILLALCLMVCAAVAGAQEPDAAIHDELRGVLKQIESAINAGEYDKMLPVLSEQVRATPVNQEFLASREDVSKYFKRWFGQGGYLKKLEISLAADALTELSADKSWGIVRGKGVEKYILADGRPYELKTRWTATMAKEADGKWRLRALHVGTDFLDNPILAEAEHALLKAAAIAGVLGVLVGLVLGWLFGRKKKA